MGVASQCSLFLQFVLLPQILIVSTQQQTIYESFVVCNL